MNRRRANVLVACAALSLLLWADRARSACPPLPSASNSVLPSHVILVGRDGAGTADPLGEFVVVVKSLCGALLSGQLVEVSFRFSLAVRIASSGYPPGVTVECSPTSRSVRRVSDANGEARFSIPGVVAPANELSPPLAEILVEGRVYGAVIVATPDLDGQGGVGANDLSNWLGEFGASNPSRGDYDGSGDIGANDLSLWLQFFAAGGSQVTPSPLCP